MTDLALPFPPNVRSSDPETSHEASAVERSILRARVRRALELAPHGLTDWELVDALGMDRSDKGTVGKRRQECFARPIIVDDEPLKRPSPKGKPCRVWTLR